MLAATCITFFKMPIGLAGIMIFEMPAFIFHFFFLQYLMAIMKK